jgi:hypothetical protein
MSEQQQQQQQQSSKKAPRGKSFKPEEDKTLCHSWLAVSGNPRVGTNQTAEQFWKSVQDEVEKTSRQPSTRNHTSLMNRFGEITKFVSKFSGCYQEVVSTYHSGHSEDDIVFITFQNSIQS